MKINKSVNWLYVIILERNPGIHFGMKIEVLTRSNVIKIRREAFKSKI